MGVTIVVTIDIAMAIAMADVTNYRGSIIQPTTQHTALPNAHVLFGFTLNGLDGFTGLFESPTFAQSHQVSAPAISTHESVEVSRVLASDETEAAPFFKAHSPNHVTLTLPDIGQFHIRNGQTIEVQHPSTVSDELLGLYLLGSAMGCILHQRGLIPLHISTVLINGQAWGFTAPSGTGKSTLGARLHHFAGCPMVSDDVAALYKIDGQPHVAGGPPLMKLQPEFAALFEDAHVSPIPHPEANKLRVQPKHAFVQGLVPLAGMVVLERDETVAPGDLAIEPLAGTGAFLGAREAIYRYQMGLAMSSQAHMFEKLTELATHVPFYQGRLGEWNIEMGGQTEPAIVERLARLAQ